MLPPYRNGAVERTSSVRVASHNTFCSQRVKATRNRLARRHTRQSTIVPARSMKRVDDDEVLCWRHRVMKGTVGGILAVVLTLTPPGIASMLTAQELPEIPSTFPPIAEVKLPPYKMVELSNGLRVFLLEDHEIGIVNGSLLMKGGARGDPADKVGVAAIAAAVQRSGGSEAHPASELDGALEDLAAYVEVRASAGSVAASFGALAEDADQVVGLFGEVVRAPRFPDTRLQLAKDAVLDRLEHRNDQASAIPRRELAKVLYGSDSVFAREPVVKNVQEMSTADLRSYYEKWERPDNAVLGICGDFDTNHMIELVNKVFGDWAPASGQPETPYAVPNSPVPEQRPSTIYLVDKPGAVQASVAMGQLGTLLDDPDIHALDALNGMLNGFGGRLFNEVRSREGLAYSVSGAFSPGLDHPGTFVVGAETQSPAQLIAAVKRVLNETRTAELPESELNQAKEKALNSFVFNFSNSSSQLNRIIAYALFDIPQEYLFDYRNGLVATSTLDVLGASQRHLQPEDLQIVVVGDAKSVEPKLKDLLGIPVQRLDVGK